MARVTVEDCVRVIHNRFVLVVLASSRTRQLGTGEKAHIYTGKDKDPVVALKEIADKKVDPDKLENSYIASFQKNLAKEEPEKDDFTIEDEDLEDLPLISEDSELDDLEKDDEEFDLNGDSEVDLDSEDDFEDDNE